MQPRLLKSNLRKKRRMASCRRLGSGLSLRVELFNVGDELPNGLLTLRTDCRKLDSLALRVRPYYDTGDVNDNGGIWELK